MSQMLFADFSNHRFADRAMEQLEEIGYRPDELHFITMTSDKGERILLSQSAVPSNIATSIGRGALLGGAIGFLFAAILSQPANSGNLTDILTIGFAGGVVLGASFNTIRRLFKPIGDGEHFETIIGDGGVVIGVPVNPADEPTVREILFDCQQGRLETGWSDDGTAFFLSTSSASATRSNKYSELDSRIHSTWL